MSEVTLRIGQTPLELQTDEFRHTLASTYRQIFLETRAHEVHDTEATIARYAAEMHAGFARPYLLTAYAGPELVGFLWGYSAPYGEHVFHLRTVYFPDISETDWSHTNERIGRAYEEKGKGGDVAFVSEFGMLRHYREEGFTITGPFIWHHVDTQLARDVHLDISWSRDDFSMSGLMRYLGSEIFPLTNIPNDHRVVVITDLDYVRSVVGESVDDSASRLSRHIRKKIIEERRNSIGG